MKFMEKKFFLAIILIAITQLTSYANDTDTYLNKQVFLEQIGKKRLFTFNVDKDKNNFPDTWFIQKGKGFQQYHSILIDNQTGSDDRKSLRFVFTGGKTGVYTAPIVLSQRFAYNISLFHKIKQLKKQFGHSFIFGLRALDENQKVIDIFKQNIDNSSENWKQTPILRIEKLPKNVKSCVLFIEIEGRYSERNLFWIDQIEITSSPRIQLSTKRDLNIFNQGEEIHFDTSIHGTIVGKNYELEVNIQDFLGQIVENKKLTLAGKIEAYHFKEKINKPSSETGVYYINLKLSHQSQLLAEKTEIVARKITQKNTNHSEFGVLLGEPKPPFSNLLFSLEMLGSPISKINLLPSSFSFKEWNKKEGLISFNPLLLRDAPDKGFKFIGVLDKIPTEADNHFKFRVNPANHITDTFTTHTTEWGTILDDILFKYGNVLSDWQFGPDNISMTQEKVKEAKPIYDLLKDKADWMKVFYPIHNDLKSLNSQTPNYFIKNSIPLNKIKEKISQLTQTIPVTLELDSEFNTKRPQIIANLVKKISILRSAKLENGTPKTKPIFIDSLNSDSKGLMTKDYKPHSTYFAAKTVFSWMQNSEFIGSFFIENKNLENYVFTKADKAFVVLWNNKNESNDKFYLGKQVQLMDLMGNKNMLSIATDQSITVKTSSIPVILITDKPNLWKTILSYQLLNKNIEAAIKLQNQNIQLTNHFKNNGKFDLEIRYPGDWVLENNIFASEIQSKQTEKHNFKLSPSALSPVGKPIKTYNHLRISLPNENHFVVIYREDNILSDILPDMKFYKTHNGLQIDIHIGISEKFKGKTSFIASAMMPGGEVIEALFKNVKTGQKSIYKSYLPAGLNYIGQDAQLSIRQHTGTKSILKSFPIKLAF